MYTFSLAAGQIAGSGEDFGDGRYPYQLPKKNFFRSQFFSSFMMSTSCIPNITFDY
jgi:hypothetical protein